MKIKWIIWWSIVTTNLIKKICFNPLWRNRGAVTNQKVFQSRMFKRWQVFEQVQWTILWSCSFMITEEWTYCVLLLRAYLAALPTNPPECSRRVWSRNGREGCSDMQHDVITQMVYLNQTMSVNNCWSFGSFLTICAVLCAGIVWYVTTGSEPREMFALAAPLHAMLYYEEKDILVTLTERMMLAQFSVSATGDVEPIGSEVSGFVWFLANLWYQCHIRWKSLPL